MAEQNGKSPPIERRAGAGGRRLAAAFDAVSVRPALAEARRRLVDVCDRRAISNAELIAAIEADAAIAIAVMRAANNGNGAAGRSGGVRDAVEELGPGGVRAIVSGLGTYDVIEHPGLWSEQHERFRRHAVAVRLAAERIGELARIPDPDELAVAALLHDVGRLVLVELYGESYGLDPRGGSPTDGVRRERRELGIDHALVGAVLIRRWGMRPGVAAAVERHHAADADGHAAAIRLADLVAHYVAGDPVPADEIRAAGDPLGLEPEQLNSLLFDFPHGGASRRRAAEPCPLSMREVDALRGLAEGKVYKQIAQELSLSVSTVRTHLHNVYRKIGAVDRAQAVLIARDRGWL